jgi:hypothetical protein
MWSKFSITLRAAKAKQVPLAAGGAHMPVGHQRLAEYCKAYSRAESTDSELSRPLSQRCKVNGIYRGNLCSWIVQHQPQPAMFVKVDPSIPWD